MTNNLADKIFDDRRTRLDRITINAIFFSFLSKYVLFKSKVDVSFVATFKIWKLESQSSKGYIEGM